jgi:hypothetical protein
MTQQTKPQAPASKPLYPTGRCNFCRFTVPAKALWCSTGCAQDYAAAEQTEGKTA